MDGYSWHAVDLKSGKRGPQLQVKALGKPKRIIGEATDLTVEVLIEDNGVSVPDWEFYTEEGRAALVLVDAQDQPLWAGMVLRCIITGDIFITLALATHEHYFSRRYMFDWTVIDKDQGWIAEIIVSNSVALDGIQFVVPPAVTGTNRDRRYYDNEDKTVLSILTSLMNIQNGLEFTVDLAWRTTDHLVLDRIVTIRSRIGVSLPLPVRFEYPGPVQSFTSTRDWTTENAANDVLAVSSGEGEFRPQSAHHVDQVAIDSGVPLYERRFSPSTSISNVSTLDAHATDELDRVHLGLRELKMLCNLDDPGLPRLNVDWWLGDDITAVITCPAYPAERGPDNELLPGLEHTVRVVGWEIDLDARTLTPITREYL